MSFQTEPVLVSPGEKLNLKIESIDKDGKRTDITHSPNINLDVTFYKLHVCGKGQLCIWPKNKGQALQNDSLIYGDASMQVEYIDGDKKIGFNGFSLDIQP